MPLVLHHGHLRPLVRLHLILLHRIQTLLPTEASKNVDIASALSDSVGVPAFIHGTLVGDLVLQRQVESRIFFRRRASACD